MNTPSPNLPIVGVLDTLRRYLAAENTVGSSRESVHGETVE